MSSIAPVLPAKAELRRRSIAARGALDTGARHEASCRIRENLRACEPFAKARLVCTYASYRDEVATGELIRELLAAGRRVAVPAHFHGAGGPMCFAEIRSWAELVPNHFGILQPALANARVLHVETIPLFLIPGLAFDSDGGRLGYGLGCYDRTLTGADPGAVKIGLAFEIQVIERVPTDTRDVPMDLVATEKRLITVPPRTGAPKEVRTRG